ncbi:efflux RND transporter periplasmic adaptor subunit [Rhodobacteraceae bacterium NNCM2]|nr:efflux RND transporter periplasmic adaptor subunit [Coraliihabitans acroporae]
MSKPVSTFRQIIASIAILGLAGAGWFYKDEILQLVGGTTEASQARQSSIPKGVPVIVEEVRFARDDLVLEVVGTGRATRSIMLQSKVPGRVVQSELAANKSFREGDLLIQLDDRDQRFALSTAETQLEEAERVKNRVLQLSSSGTAAGSRRDEVVTAANVASFLVDRARIALEDRTLTAPFDGVVGLPSIEVGAWIDTDTEIASYDDRSALLVEFDVPEAVLARLHDGFVVSARTPSVPGEVFEGSVVAIDSRILSGSRTVRVRVSIPNDDDRLRPGASFTVRLDLPGGNFPLVPELAVRFAQGSLQVWRIADGKAEAVDIDLVRRREGAILVDGPLEEGDLVVVEGTQRLAPGKAVTITDIKGASPEQARTESGL